MVSKEVRFICDKEERSDRDYCGNLEEIAKTNVRNIKGPSGAWDDSESTVFLKCFNCNQIYQANLKGDKKKLEMVADSDFYEYKGFFQDERELIEVVKGHTGLYNEDYDENSYYRLHPEDFCRKIKVSQGGVIKVPISLEFKEVLVKYVDEESS